MKYGICAILLFLFVLSGCGGGGGDNSSQPTSNNSDFISGVKDPEVEGFILSLGSYGTDTPAKELAKTLGLTTGSVTDDVPWVSQMPPGNDWSLARHCGLASYIMVDAFYNKGKVVYDENNTPDKITDLIKLLAKIQPSYQPINNIIGNYTSTVELAALAQHNGFNAAAVTIKDDALINLLASNKPVIVAVYTQMKPVCKDDQLKVLPWVSESDCKKRGGHSNGHFMVITKMDSGSVTVNDPGRSWDQEKKNHLGKNINYSYSEFSNCFDQKGRNAVVIWPTNETIQVGIVTKTVGQSTAQINHYYSSTIVASGGSSSYTWEVTKGECPPGISLKENGEISGTPTKEGKFTFFIRVTDKDSKYLFAEEMVTIPVTTGNDVAPVGITASESLPPARVGSLYGYILSAIGGYISDAGHYIWNVITGTQKSTYKTVSKISGMPTGLSLDKNGKLSGTPTQSGEFTFTAQVNDGSTPPQAVSKQFNLTVFPAYMASPKIIQNLPSGTTGTIFKQSGSGFTPNTTAVLYFKYVDQDTTSSLNVGIDASGSFSIDYPVPSGKPKGSYFWWGQDSSGAESNKVYYTIADSSSSSNSPPIAEAAVSTSLSGPYYGYDTPLTVIRGQSVNLYFFADKDVNRDDKASVDPEGWTDPDNGVSSGGYAEWNKDLNQGTPTFEVKINNPSSAGSANIGPFSYTFNDAPGTYEYQVLRITDRKGAQSNTSRIKINVVASPTGGIYGTLHESSAAGLALSGATVTCGGKSTITGSNGSFSLSGITLGNQTLTLSKAGYQSFSLSVSISSGSDYNAGDRWLLSDTPSYEGWIDSTDCGNIIGWAWDKNHPDSTATVDIYDGSSKITSVSAGGFRQDLLNAGKGNGYHGFTLATPTSTKDGTTHTISIKFGGTSTSLSGSPKSLLCTGYASISDGVKISANPVVLGNNFKISFTLKEVRGAAKFLDEVAVRVTDPDGNWFDFVKFSSVSLSANGSKDFDYTNYIYTTRPTGKYWAEVWGRVGDGWFSFDTVNSGTNPKSFSVSR